MMYPLISDASPTVLLGLKSETSFLWVDFRRFILLPAGMVELFLPPRRLFRVEEGVDSSLEASRSTSESLAFVGGVRGFRGVGAGFGVRPREDFDAGAFDECCSGEAMRF